MTMLIWTQFKLFGRVHLLSLSQLSIEILVNQGEFGKEAKSFYGSCFANGWHICIVLLVVVNCKCEKFLQVVQNI
jgi:hypothetical protein